LEVTQTCACILSEIYICKNVIKMLFEMIQYTPVAGALIFVYCGVQSYLADFQAIFYSKRFLLKLIHK